MTIFQKKILDCGIACLAGAFLAFAAGALSQNLSDMAIEAGGPAYLREPVNLGLAALGLLLWHRLMRRDGSQTPHWGHVGVGLGLGLSLGIMLPGAALWLLSVMGGASLSAPTISKLALGVPLIFLIVHSFAEESLVRVIAQRTGHHQFGPLGGVLAAALCFCLLQAAQGYFSFWYLVNSALFGTCLVFLALGSGGIWAAVGAHAGWSWLETAFFGQAGQITKAPTWFSGIGPDSYGSPAFTIVLTVVIGAQLTLHLMAQKSMNEL
jgi:membrane protease YdiL (CAAX protease family)